MPIQCQIICRGELLNLQPLMAGDLPVSLTDLGGDGRCGGIVIVVCAPTDDGGIVYLSTEGMMVESREMRVIQPDDLRVERTLAANETYERPIRTRDGMAARLIVSHIEPWATKKHP